MKENITSPFKGRFVFFLLSLLFPFSHQTPGQSIASLRAQAELLYTEANYTQSLKFYRLALDKSIRENQPVWRANLLLDISSVVFISGDYGECTKLVQEAIGVMQRHRIQNDSTYFKLWSGLGQYFFKLSVIDSSFYYFGKADHLLASRPELEKEIPLYVIFHYSNQSLAHRNFGRYVQGISLAEKALKLAEKEEDKHSIALLQNVLADQYSHTGEYEKSYLLRRSALNDYKHNDFGKVQIYSGLGKTCLLKNDYRNAKQYFEKAVALQEKLAGKDLSQKNRNYLANAYNGLAASYIKLGQYEQAIANLERSESIFSKSPNELNLHLIKCLKLLGDVYVHLSDYDRALFHYRHAINILSGKSSGQSVDPGFEKVAIEILSAMGNAYATERKYPEALEAFERALSLYHTARQYLFELDDKLFLGQFVLPMYNKALDAAYNVYSARRENSAFEQAFRIVVQNHAVGLKDKLHDNELRPAYLPLSITSREDSLKKELHLFQSKIQRGASHTEMDRAGLLKAQQAYFHFLKDLERRYPAYYYAKYLPKDDSSKKLRDMLDQQTAFVSFSYTHGHLHLFAITKESYTWKTLPLDSLQIFQTLESLRNALHTQPGLKQYNGTQQAIQTFDWFIRPLYERIKSKKRWVIQSGGLLDGVPVEVLETGRKEGDYLTLHHNIHYVYTVSSAFFQSAPRINTAPQILGVAPFGTKETRYHSVRNQHKLPQLPSSIDEVRNIATKYYLLEAAKKSEVLAELNEYDILHLATHTTINKSHPMSSYISFYPEPNQIGNWYGHEISNHNLQHIRMTVLSSCEIEKGHYFPMEGVISLARCFAFAGCPTLTATLWEAQDNASALLMNFFYGHLKNGLRPSEALQKARLEFLRSDTGKRFNHPFFWGNFIVVGQDLPVFPQPSPFALSRILPFFAGFAVLIGFLKIWSSLPRRL